MKQHKGKIILAAGVLLVIAVVMGALRPHRNLVSLNVQGADLREVIRIIERQTREQILVHQDLNARITLKVRNMPIEGVLNAIGMQASALWMTFYPLYTHPDALKDLEAIVLADAPSNRQLWTNLTGANMPKPGGMFGQNVRQQNQLVTLNVQNQELDLVALAVSRFANVQIVPEDGTQARVSLRVSQMPVPKVVAQVARQAQRKWSRFFVLRPLPKMPPPQMGGAFGRPGPPSGMPGMAQRPPPSEAELARMSAEERQRHQQMEEMMRQQMDAQLQAMPPAQRAQAMQRRQQMEAMRNMTPEQRQQQTANMPNAGGGPGPGGDMIGNPGGGDTAQSIQQLNATLLNTTSDQRVEKARQMQSRQNQ